MWLLACVNDLTLFVKKVEGEKELSCDFLHHGERNPSLWKEATIFGHVRTYGLKDKAHVISIGPPMFKLVQKTQNMIGAEMRSIEGSNAPQDVQLEGVMLSPIGVCGQNLQSDMLFCPSLLD